MIAYHLDRSGKLEEGAVLNLLETNANPEDSTFKNYGLHKVSHWGMLCYNYLKNIHSDPSSIYDFDSVNSFSIDLQAESIRNSCFPNKPSRFQSIFAVENLHDFKLWESYLPINKHSHIFEIEFEDSLYCKVDANFLRGGIVPSSTDSFSYILQITDCLQKYWSGQMSENPLPELLIPLPVTIKRLLAPDEFIL